MATIRSLPQALLEEIFLRCDVKTVGNSRAVLKEWCPMLTDREFIRKHAEKCSTKRVLLSNGVYYTTYAFSDPLRRQQQRMPWDQFSYNQLIWGSCNGLILGTSYAYNCFFLTNIATRNMWQHPVTLHHEVFWGRDKRLSFVRSFGFGCDDKGSGDYKAVCMVYREAQSGRLIPECGKKVAVTVYNLTQHTRRLIPQPYDNMLTLSTRGVLLKGKIHWIVGNGSVLRICTFNLEDESFGEVYFPETIDITFSVDNIVTSYKLVAIGQKKLGLFSESNEDDLWILDDYTDRNSWRKITVEGINIRRAPPIDVTTNGDIVFGNQEGLNYYNTEEQEITGEIEFGEFEADSVFVDCTFVETLVSPNLDL